MSGDDIGYRGEALFYVMLTKFYGRPAPLFRPHFLGDKFPNIDFLVELSGVIPHTPYFFAQVKTTRLGYTSSPRRLRVRVSEKTVKALSSYPAPAYLFGIDDNEDNEDNEDNPRGYVVSVNGEFSHGLSSIPINHEINDLTQDVLWNEVREFWAGRSKKSFVSHFAI